MTILAEVHQLYSHRKIELMCILILNSKALSQDIDLNILLLLSQGFFQEGSIPHCCLIKLAF